MDRLLGLFRLLLAYSVVMGHLGPAHLRLASGDAAVQIFFAISGFYMALVYRSKYVDAGLFAFYSNRFLRLYPSYLVVLIATVIWSLANSATVAATSDDVRTYIETASASTWVAAALVNLVMALQDTFLYLQLDPATGNLVFASSTFGPILPAYKLLLIPQTWSIGVEIAFYVLVPILAFWRVRLLMAAIAFGLVVKLTTYEFFGVTEPWAYRFAFSEIACFAAGMIMFRVYEKWNSRPAFGSLGLPALTFCVAATVTYRFVPEIDAGPFSQMWLGLSWYNVYVVLSIVSIPFVFRLTNRNATDRVLGDLSYPVYICHLTVAVIVPSLYDGPGYEYVVYAAPLVVSLFLLALVERPIDRWRQSRVTAASPHLVAA